MDCHLDNQWFSGVATIERDILELSAREYRFYLPKFGERDTLFVGAYAIQGQYGIQSDTSSQ